MLAKRWTQTAFLRGGRTTAACLSSLPYYYYAILHPPPREKLQRDQHVGYTTTGRRRAINESSMMVGVFEHKVPLIIRYPSRVLSTGRC